MNPHQIIKQAIRRASKPQAAPILRYERYSTAPSARPVWILCVALMLAFGALTVLVNVYQGPVVECGRVK